MYYPLGSHLSYSEKAELKIAAIIESGGMEASLRLAGHDRYPAHIIRFSHPFLQPARRKLLHGES